MSGSPETLAVAQDLDRPNGLCRPGLFLFTVLGVPALLVPGCVVMASLADAAWGAYAVVAVAVVAYAGLATHWVREGRRQGATSGQWFLGGALAFAFVVLCAVVILLIYGLAHMGPVDM